MPSLNQVSKIKINQTLERFTKLSCSDDLSSEFDRVPTHNYHQLKEFLAELNRHGDCLGRATVFKELSSSGYKYDTDNLITSSNVCFQTEDTMASKHKALKTKKINTWIMCPICDPFEKLKEKKAGDESRTKKVTIGGTTWNLPIRSPLHGFYATLNSSYVHHMAECHGVHGKASIKEPIVGFTGPEMSLNVICPYSGRKGGRGPCLAMTPYNYQRKNGFKGYYRHVEKCHFGNASLSKVNVYSPKHVFVPLNNHQCNQVTDGMASQWLNLQTDMSIEASINNTVNNLFRKTDVFFRSSQPPFIPAPAPAPAPESQPQVSSSRYVSGLSLFESLYGGMSYNPADITVPNPEQTVSSPIEKVITEPLFSSLDSTTDSMQTRDFTMDDFIHQQDHLAEQPENEQETSENIDLNALDQDIRNILESDNYAGCSQYQQYQQPQYPEQASYIPQQDQEQDHDQETYNSQADDAFLEYIDMALLEMQKQNEIN